MAAIELHPWQVTTEQARQIQETLASKVSRQNHIKSVRFIAGADISAPRGSSIARAAVVVLRFPELDVAEVQTAQGELQFPYVPGLLSFREAPLVLEVCERLELTPDLLFVDGQGLAHPRRMGIACHLGLLLDIPTIGCAKSRLWGTHEPVGPEAGARVELLDDSEVIGAVLRTSPGGAPLYISIGHKVDLDNACYWVMQCCLGHRLPEPARLAHMAAAGELAEGLHLEMVPKAQLKLL